MGAQCCRSDGAGNANDLRGNQKMKRDPAAKDFGVSQEEVNTPNVVKGSKKPSKKKNVKDPTNVFKHGGNNIFDSLLYNWFSQGIGFNY